MAFFWAKATTVAAMSAKLERLREAERALIELAFEQTTEPSTSTIKTSNSLPPIIQPFDTHIPVSCIHHSNITREISSNLEHESDDLYKIHGISITSQNGHENLRQCDKPLVLLHGYSKLFYLRRFEYMDY